MGTKRSVLVDEKGIPLSVILDGANRHDIKLLQSTLEHIIIDRPEATSDHPQHLCMDAGYTGSAKIVETKGYTAHILPRAEERKEKETNPNFKARRWVVEGIHSFFNLSVSFSSVLKRKPITISPCSTLPALLLSGENACLSTFDYLRIGSKEIK